VSKFDDYIQAIREGVKVLTKDTFGDFLKEADVDAKAYLEKIKVKLNEWTIELAENKISQDDFKDLVEAQKDLAAIHALTQAGAALVKCERFRSGLIELVINKAFEVFL
jgi:hypothetical protein